MQPVHHDTHVRFKTYCSSPVRTAGPAMSERLVEALAGQSVTITGGAGFIGSRLAACLTPVCEVTILDDLSTGDRSAVPEQASLIRGDVRKQGTVERAVADADVVFHLAAISDVGTTIEAPVAAHETNATGSLLVLEAARKADARVVVSSSAAVYGRPTELPIAETEPMTPRSPYGITKLTTDCYARTFADQYGLSTVALRYFNVYGQARGDITSQGVVRTFIDRALAGEPLEIHGDGQQTRDFVHISDVVRATLHGAVTTETGRAYNIGTGQQTTILEVAESIISMTDSDSQIKHEQPRDGDIRHSCADVSRAQKELGFEAADPFEKGLQKMLERCVPETAD